MRAVLTAVATTSSISTNARDCPQRPRQTCWCVSCMPTASTTRLLAAPPSGAVDQPRQPQMGSWLEKQEKQGNCWEALARYWPSLIPTPIWRRPSWISPWTSPGPKAMTSAARSCARSGGWPDCTKKAPEHASLAVLKAPDIPSVLVETGFISNHAEEKLLATASYPGSAGGPSSRGSQLLPQSSDQGPMLTGKGQVAARRVRRLPTSRSLSASRLPSQRSRS